MVEYLIAASANVTNTTGEGQQLQQLRLSVASLQCPQILKLDARWRYKAKY
jgi:hypothetical protein